MLGTGNAVVTECYNTCFVISDHNRRLLVDGGGGSGILVQLKRAGIEANEISDVFVTHKHIDHILGVLWLMRVRSRGPNELRIYSHDEVIGLLRAMAENLAVVKPTAWDRIKLISVDNGENRTVIGRDVTFFDLGSTKVKQFGFSMDLGDGDKLACFGDEPCNEQTFRYAKGAKWILHEAFCMEMQKDRFRPHEKHHSTVKDACELAARAGAKNLVLYHTEDSNILARKELYSSEGARYFAGNLFVPDDLEAIEL